jgi:hypothetical protein
VRATAPALLALLGVLTGGLTPAGAAGAASPGSVPLRWDATLPDVASTYGSGDFGQWTTDGFGLPAYRYTLDEQTSPLARQAELAGGTDAWSQVGNDRIKADAFNHGDVELWTQDRLAQWVDRLDPAHLHLGGGFGYLDVDGRVASTLYDDRPAEAVTERRFGVGYFAHSTATSGVTSREEVVAPFGNDPVLVHDVHLTNDSPRPEHVSWDEYWDVNPYVPSSSHYRGTTAPTWSPRARTLAVRQVPSDGDEAPLSIFLAQVGGTTDGFTTSQASFFGPGGRTRPTAVAAGHLDDRLSDPVADGTEGTTLFAMQSRVTLGPGRSTTLRYVYGAAEPSAVPGLVARYRAESDPWGTSEARWAAALPKATFGPSKAWLAREFLWDAYLLRSATVDEQLCGEHTVTQGGYYQYEIGENWGTRSWLQYAVPLAYMAPDLARQSLVYSAQFQPASNLQFPYGSTGLCRAYQLGRSDDFDLWFMWAAANYGLATRDAGYFDTPVRFYGSTKRVSLWRHLELAFDHQQSLLGPHGEYRALSTGDWSDLLPTYSGMTESDLVVAQCAYVYPQLAALARLRGDSAFARRLTQAGAAGLATLRRQWTGQGWYARGYAGSRLLGSGAIWLEPQPWAVLAGAPSTAQASTLVANIRRYLDGVGAPAPVRVPDRIGTSLGPARDDPGITETTPLPGGGEGNDNAVYPGGTWYEPDGWLTWAYATLDGQVPGAGSLALDEYERSTLADHAAAFPQDWVGITSVDDTCWSFYSSDPGRCGGVLGVSDYEGQNTEQPEWMVMDAVDLCGITPTASGYAIAPHLPLADFSVRFPGIGVAVRPRQISGYLRPLASGGLILRVAVPASVSAARVTVGGSTARVPRRDGVVVLHVRAGPGRPTDWSVRWS